MRNLIYILFVGFGLMVTSCEDPGSSILFDENFIELDAGTTVTGSRTYSYLRQDDGVGVPSGFEVNLGARQQGSPINYTFSIDPSSTAIENLHYTLQGTSGTIDANSSISNLPITILDDNINPGEELTIVVNLTGGDVTVHELYGTGTHIIQVTCPSELGGTYSAVTVGTSTDGCCPGEVTSMADVSLTDQGGGNYLISDWSAGIYVDWYGPNGGNYGITEAFVDGGGLNATITDVCGTISGSFGEPFGQPVALSGTVDSSTGVITYSWTSGWGDTATTVLTPK